MVLFLDFCFLVRVLKVKLVALVQEVLADAGHWFGGGGLHRLVVAVVEVKNVV